jgi:hypothetical protein
MVDAFKSDVREYPFPEIPPDARVLEIEAAGVCGSGRFPLHRMATHRFGLADVDQAVRSVGGQGAPGAVHVTVLPWS